MLCRHVLQATQNRSTMRPRLQARLFTGQGAGRPKASLDKHLPH